ncbi:hypothetical protein EDC44_1134 [Cricetibacter osteomyelitidis]|uniref:Cof subfamily protein (Haloacid dehalogenase superfamily)/HAD superfamily hydrolase (TIGR01484 family) n=1 Tax=Cricetibacter osteomyelitidis TaxID=1521931 RepID=A0A4R2SWJ8_9PAST|nr:Cof-type HAD-IIB family hydrolase [Cricetibacter osteomyelitidis]TCP94859.1 hypothetical protein EDC44_1134 [Cricetibacter osteomyelitidis]
MQKMPFRAVVSDLDGTLLNAKHVIGDFTIDTLNKLEQKGLDIILATGRNHTDVGSILGKVGAEHAVMITSNGARVHDLQGNLIYANNLPERIAFELINFPVDTTRVRTNIYQDDGWFMDLDLPELKKYHKDSGFMYKLVDFKQHHGRGTEKVFFIGKTLADLEPIAQCLREKYADQITVVYSTPQCLEVMNKNVSKATALAHLIAQREYGLADCIAFGDGMNDEEMLKEVGKGLLMGNADPRLKAVCCGLEQIGFNKDEAVASYLRATFGIY